MSNNILFVGGTFDENGGRPSSLVEKIANSIKKESSYFNLSFYNGGSYSDLSSIIEECLVSDFVLWWANVPNGLDKISILLWNLLITRLDSRQTFAQNSAKFEKDTG